jgi:hypothetical protein
MSKGLHILSVFYSLYILLNRLKPRGNYMYHLQLSIRNFAFCIYGPCMILSQCKQGLLL